MGARLSSIFNLDSIFLVATQLKSAHFPQRSFKSLGRLLQQVSRAKYCHRYFPLKLDFKKIPNFFFHVPVKKLILFEIQTKSKNCLVSDFGWKRKKINWVENAVLSQRRRNPFDFPGEVNEHKKVKLGFSRTELFSSSEADSQNILSSSFAKTELLDRSWKTFYSCFCKVFTLLGINSLLLKQ